jgi:hypothetical protein
LENELRILRLQVATLTAALVALLPEDRRTQLQEAVSRETLRRLVDTVADDEDT